VTLLQDHERGDEFAAKEIVAVARLRKRRERANDVLALRLIAVIAFDPPDRKQKKAVDAEFCLDRRERLGEGDHAFFSARDAAIGDEQGDIAADRSDIFRLALGGGDHLRIGLNAFEGGVEGRARNAARFRLRPQIRDVGLKILRRLFRRGRAACGEGDR
jgi:hypothetical protein